MTIILENWPPILTITSCSLLFLMSSYSGTLLQMQLNKTKLNSILLLSFNNLISACKRNSIITSNAFWSCFLLSVGKCLPMQLNKEMLSTWSSVNTLHQDQRTWIQRNSNKLTKNYALSCYTSGLKNIHMNQRQMKRKF